MQVNWIRHCYLNCMDAQFSGIALSLFPCGCCLLISQACIFTRLSLCRSPLPRPKESCVLLQFSSVPFSHSVLSDSANPWIAARQASLFNYLDIHQSHTLISMHLQEDKEIEIKSELLEDKDNQTMVKYTLRRYLDHRSIHSMLRHLNYV